MKSEALESDAELLAPARRMRERAYAPYSGFSVGAALQARDGSIFGGANVENASYGLSICAERSAVVAAVAAGHRDFRAIAVAGPEQSVAAPCGACRQFLHEFNPRMTVIYTERDRVVATTLDRLLPDAFDPEDLS